MVKEKNKIIYLEILRILAAFFVIFNHTGNDGFFLFSLKSSNHLPFWIYAFISVFCKFAVPLFFMISGSLYLKRDNLTIKEIYLKRILKIFIITLVFSTIYYLYLNHLKNVDISFLSYLKQLITCGISSHFWYLYMYIIFLMTLPFLKIIVNNMDHKLFNYLIIIMLIFDGIIPIINFLIFKEELTFYRLLTPIWALNIVFIYPIVGYYLDNKIDLSEHKKRIIPLWIINIILIIITCLMTKYHANITHILSEKTSQIFYNNFVIINAITIFLTIKYLTPNNKFNSILAKTGKYTFGIYLFHIIVMKTPYFNDFITHLKDINLNTGLIALIMCLTTYIISFIITFAISNIPFLKKLVGF